MIANGLRRPLAALALAAAGAGGALAHTEVAHTDEGAGHAPAAEAGAHGSLIERAVDLTAAADPPVVEVPLGKRVRLVLLGAGAGELHLHGYDVDVEAEAGVPAVFVFDAAHTGRFAVTAHGADDLLGSVERALLYVEVRDR